MPEYEILEMLLFNAIERIDVKPLAKRLLSAFGDLNGVIAASEHRLLQVEGATKKVYYQLRLAEALAQRMRQTKVLKRDIFSSWNDLITYCRTSMAHRETEQFRILFLDRDPYGRIIARCSAGGSDFATALVEEGLAWAFVDYSDDYVALQRQAKTAAIRVWRAAFNQKHACSDPIEPDHR